MNAPMQRWAAKSLKSRRLRLGVRRAAKVALYSGFSFALFQLTFHPGWAPATRGGLLSRSLMAGFFIGLTTFGFELLRHSGSGDPLENSGGEQE